ncbi:MAG TPA: hypothetical protein VMH20_16160 [Verrucomicrobiae bacterium]|nr:hypothetical protein [Verrucomicrobiae bacterium]
MANAHPRSAAVTAAATLSLLGCSGALLFWGYFILALLNAPPLQNGRHLYELQPGLFLLVAIVPPAVIALGIRTGIGLFQLRAWARISALVWASVTLVFCLALIAFRPFETFFIPERFVGPLESMKQLIAIALLILLMPSSIWWLFLFRLKSVKAQFGREREEMRRTATAVTSAT